MPTARGELHPMGPSAAAAAAAGGTCTACSALFWGAVLHPSSAVSPAPALPGEHINVLSMYMCNTALLSPPESRLEGTAMGTQLGGLQMFRGAGGGKKKATL